MPDQFDLKLRFRVNENLFWQADNVGIAEQLTLLIQEEGVARVTALKTPDIIGHKAIYESDATRPSHGDLCAV